LGERVLNAYEAGKLHPVGSSAIHGRATESLRAPHRRRSVWIFSSLKETMGRFMMPPEYQIWDVNIGRRLSRNL
jgi:hypothetical protein